MSVSSRDLLVLDGGYMREKETERERERERERDRGA